MNYGSLKISIKSSLFDPDLPDTNPNKKISQVKKSADNKLLRRIYLYVDGYDVLAVMKVTYYLHPTFKNNVITVEQSVSNPKCKLVIWAWGYFLVNTVVEDRFGNSYRLSHDIDWRDELKMIQG